MRSSFGTSFVDSFLLANKRPAPAPGDVPEGGSGQHGTALESKFKDKIRPILDTIDKLRNLGVVEEGISLPTIVVIGDQSSGKSSVLESLAGISLPRGQGIATRAPLVLRLQASGKESITIEYGRQKKTISESEIEMAVVEAQNTVAGFGKNISSDPISLHIRKANAPDLTMVDLPGITRVPVAGQPENIYQQIAEIIRKYITPADTVILNVLSANVDFPTCESIRMSQLADKAGERTLAVVTKVDQTPDGLLEKVTTNAVNIGLGYICVRNRVADAETHEEARQAEKQLFESHELLSKLDKSIVGIPALSDRLTKIQANSIARCLPTIIEQIERKVKSKEQELATLPPRMENAPQAFMAFMMSRTDILKQLVIRGDFDDYPEHELHYTARLDDLFAGFTRFLENSGSKLMEKANTKAIVALMSESKGVNLANFLPAHLFRTLFRKELDGISEKCATLVKEAHDYAETMQMQVIGKCTEGYPLLRQTSQRLARTVIQECRERCEKFMENMLSKEREVTYTRNKLYMEIVRAAQAKFESNNKTGSRGYAPCQCGTSVLTDEDLGQIDPSEASQTKTDAEYQTALDIKVSLAAYWAVVRKRIADALPHEIKYALQQTMVEGVQNKLLSQISSPNVNMEEVMGEDTVLADKRKKLSHSVEVLRTGLQMIMAMSDSHCNST